jgi:hypothetical protein
MYRILGVVAICFLSTDAGYCDEIAPEALIKVAEAIFDQAQNIEYEANDRLTVKSIETGQIDESQSLERKVTGILSPDGNYRFEILFTRGVNSGTKWTVTFDGQATYMEIVDGGKKKVYVQRGRRDHSSLLFGANPILYPFIFLEPEFGSINDQGAYLTLADVKDKTKWMAWLQDLVDAPIKLKNQSHIVANRQTKAGEKIVFSLDLNDNHLPRSVEFRNEETSTSTSVEWSNWSKREDIILLPKNLKTTKQSLEDGLQVELETQVQGVSFPSSIADERWQIDISDADVVMDVDEKVFIPMK